MVIQVRASDCLKQTISNSNKSKYKASRQSVLCLCKSSNYPWNKFQFSGTTNCADIQLHISKHHPHIHRNRCHHPKHQPLRLPRTRRTAGQRTMESINNVLSMTFKLFISKNTTCSLCITVLTLYLFLSFLQSKSKPHAAFSKPVSMACLTGLNESWPSPTIIRHLLAKLWSEKQTDRLPLLLGCRVVNGF